MRHGVLLLCLTACTPRPLATADGELRLSPPRLELEQAWVGVLRVGYATLAWTSSAPCEVSLAATAPFELVRTEVRLGEPQTVEVRLTAGAPGVVAGTLEAVGCGQQVSIELLAVAEPPPACAATGLCVVGRFDAEAGGCTSTPVADGTPCDDPCLTSPSCSGGACVGAPRSCADSDPCTVDTCSREAGCQHLPAGGVCPPLPGCPSPCDGGTCGALSEVWRLTTTAAQVVEPMVADEAGNVFWLELEPAGPGWLVSATRTGVLRYRVPADLVNASPQPMLASGVLAFSRHLGRRVSGYRAADGALLWTRDLRADLVEANHPELAQWTTWINRGTVGANGELVFPVALWDGTGASSYWFIALRPESGATAWRAPVSEDHWELQADETGRLFERVRHGARSRVSVFDAAGQPLWSTDQDIGPTLLGHLYSSARVFTAASGAQAYSLPGANFLSPDVVLPAFAVRRPPQLAPLELFDPRTGTTLGRYDEPGAWGAMVASADDELVLLDGQRRLAVGLRGDGSPSFACAMQAGAPTGPPTIVPGLLLTWTGTASARTLHAFALPGRTGATSGWLGTYGSMARANRPK